MTMPLPGFLRRRYEEDPYGALPLVSRLIAEEGRRHWKSYAGALAFMALVAGSTAATAYLTGRVVNDAYAQRDFSIIVASSLVVIAIFTLRGFSSFAQAYLLSGVSNEIVAHNQQRLFDKLMCESLAHVSERHTSEFSNRVIYGSAAAAGVLSLLVTAFGVNLLSVVGLSAVILIQDPVMGLILVALMPIAALIVQHFKARIRAIELDRYHQGVGLLESIQEPLQGIRVVKAFGLEQHMRRRVEKTIAATLVSGRQVARLSNASMPLMEVLGGFAVAAIFLYGSYRVVGRGDPPGQFIASLSAFLLAYAPAKRLARLNIDLSGQLVGLKILYETIDSPPSEASGDHKPPLRVTAGRIAFSQVEFSYRPDSPVLRKMSFVAEPGQLTALVGPSGGGKSTILNLLLGFWMPDSGSITIDGQDITAISLRSLRSQIAYVGQDIFLFRGTLRENIAFGKLGATDEEIVAAAKAASAYEFISEFPDGFDTPVGEHGLTLSTGQRQRIAIARASLRDVPIVLLDEFTGSLDSESEHQVQEAMTRLCRGRTTLVIAHRLHTIRNADQILVVDRGQVVESGRHGELLNRGGRYAAHSRLQHDFNHAPGRQNLV